MRKNTKIIIKKVFIYLHYFPRVHHQLVPVKFNQHPQVPQADFVDQVPNPVVKRLFESSQTEQSTISVKNI